MSIHRGRDLPCQTVFAPGLIMTLVVSMTLPVNAAAQRVSFQEVTGPAGLAGFNRFSWGFGGDGITGVAAFDYNEDGLLDIYITNGKDITTPGSDGIGCGSAMTRWQVSDEMSLLQGRPRQSH